MPEVIDEVGLGDQYEECFELSAGLYSLLQERHYGLEAQYVTLFGHRMRWKITYNAREAFHFHELRTSPQGHPSYRKLVMQMHEKLAEKHPLMASAMHFVNQDEDPELTRLAAERYTQAKLQKLSDQGRAGLKSRRPSV
jgi:thymidylate synthase ThyX